jgi:hypothetical protein
MVAVELNSARFNCPFPDLESQFCRKPWKWMERGTCVCGWLYYRHDILAVRLRLR